MKRNKLSSLYFLILLVLLSFVIIVSGCIEKEEIATEETDNTTENVVSTKLETQDEDATNITELDADKKEMEADMEEKFEPVMPIHIGLWASSECYTSESELDNDYFIVYWYEFADGYKGKRYDDNGIEFDEFTYEVLDDVRLVFHYDDSDEIVNYNFDDEGKRIVLTFDDHQEKLAWVSHGTIDDIGNLGLTFHAENITPTGCDIVCEQKGGLPLGKIVWDAGYSLLMYDEESNSWGTTEVLLTDEETKIDMDSKVIKHYDWSESLGVLDNGKYYVIFPVKDVVYQEGIWNSYQYKTELIIPSLD